MRLPFLLCGWFFACAPARPIPPSSLLGPQLGPADRTAVLVVATPHLRELGQALRPEGTGPLLELLSRFAPTAICVEQLPAESLVALQARGDEPARDVLEAFARQGLEAAGATARALNLSRLDAQLRAQQRLGAGALTGPEHGELALQLLAAQELSSALLHWAHAPEPTRLALARGAPEGAAYLTERLAAPNEISQVAVRLAQRLGLDRLHAVDDHIDDELLEALPAESLEDMLKGPLVEQAVKSPLYSDLRERLARANREGDLLPVYRYLNSPDYLRADAQTQWGLFLRTHHPSGVDRARYALWESRNLGIAARISRVSAMPVGGRVLVLFGASHKPFLDEALDRLVHVRRVELDELR